MVETAPFGREETGMPRVTKVLMYLCVTVLAVMPAAAEQVVLNVAHDTGSPITENAWVFSRPDMGIQLKTAMSSDRVVFNQGPYVAPRISPDGKRILFNAMEGGFLGVWLVEKNGEGRRRVCDGSQAEWCHDGRRILLVREGRIIGHDLHSGEERVAASAAGEGLACPSQAPSGEILCVNEAGTRILLFTEGQDGEAKVLAEGEIASAAQLSPDGRMLAYQDGAHIYVAELGRGTATQMTFGPGIQTGPVWDNNGRGFCFAQSLEPFSAVAAISHVNLDDPRLPDRIEGNVHPGFDWWGSLPDSKGSHRLRGALLEVWTGKMPLSAKGQGRAVPKGKWQRLSTTISSGLLHGPVIVENDWLVLSLSRKGLTLFSKKEDALNEAIPITILSKSGSKRQRIESVELLERNQDHVVLRVRAAGDGGAGLTVRVPRTSLLLEVEDASDQRCLSIETDMALAVVPDRFANDLIVGPELAKGREELSLPDGPMTLGCIAGGLLMVVTPSQEQRVWLRKGLTGLMVSPGGTSIFVGIITGDRLWEEVEVTGDVEKEDWHATWRRPFHGQWRMAVRGQERAHSRMWSQGTLADMVDGTIPADRVLDAPPERALFYVYGRGDNTPADTLTIEDVLLDALGIEGYIRTFNIQGIRGYRTSEEPVPFRELATRKVGWSPVKVNLEKGGFGVLDIMSGAFATGSPGVTSFIRHMTEDARTMLAGLDARIEDYEHGFDLLRETLRGDAWRGMGECEWMVERCRSATDEMDRMLAEGRSAPKTSIGEVDAALERLERSLGGKGQGNLVCRREEFETFSRKCREVLAERQKVLSTYRTFAQDVRDDLAVAVVKTPGWDERGRCLRDATEALLSNRYYLEGDWRGEDPVPLKPWDPMGEAR